MPNLIDGKVGLFMLCVNTIQSELGEHEFRRR